MNTNAMTLGFDPGAGAIKLWGGNSGVEIPAIVASANGAIVVERAGLAGGITLGEPPYLVTTAGRSFYVGATAHAWGRPLENLDAERLNGAPEVEALLGAALAQLPALPDHLHLVVGLPIATVQSDTADATLAATRAWLCGQHTWHVARGGRSRYLETIVDDVTLVAQPVAAVLDHLLDNAGQIIPERRALTRAEIGVISLGMNTVELLVVEGLKLTQRFTSGRSIGVRRLLSLCDPEGLYSRGELDARLRSGSLDTATALPIWESEIRGEIESRWGATWRRFRAIIICGGGAWLLPHLAQRFEGRAHIANDPVYAIARGLDKIGMRGSGA